MRRVLLPALLAVGALLTVTGVAAADQGSSVTMTLGAHTSFDRTWNWQVSKTDDQGGAVTVQKGQSASITYTVTVSNATPAFTDSNWEVQDGILIASKSGFTINSISDVSASASQDGGTVNTNGSVGVCSTSATLSPPASFPFTGVSLLCHYTIALPDGTDGTVTSTANFGDGSSKSGSTAFNFASPGNLGAGQPVVHDGTVTVVDSAGGTLGTVSAPVGSPQVFTYSVPVDSSTCGTTDIPNTVSLLGDGGATVASDSDTVHVTVTCPPPCTPGKTANFRWHYSANGTSGSWSGTKTQHCGTSFSMGPQAMEGDLKLAPNTTIRGGYDLTVPGNNQSLFFTVTSPQIVFTLQCVSGPNPSAPNNTLTLTMPTATYNITNSAWYPSGDQKSSLVYQGSAIVPDVCNGGLVRLNQGGTFSASLS